MPLFDAISAAGAFYRIRVLMGPTGRAEIGLVTDVREACCVGSFVCWGRVCPECETEIHAGRIPISMSGPTGQRRRVTRT